MVSYCACPTRVFRDRALHEHRRPTGHPPHPILLFPHLTLGGAVRWPFTARIGRTQLHRARSASKKDRLTTPPFFALDRATPPWL